MSKRFEFIYDGPPIIPPDIKKMTAEELEVEWQKCLERHKKAMNRYANTKKRRVIVNYD